MGDFIFLAKTCVSCVSAKFDPSRAADTFDHMARAALLCLALAAFATAKTADRNAYDDKIKRWRSDTDKAKFIKDFNNEQKGSAPVKGARADRLWVHINDMLDNHAVRFKDGPGLEFSYYLPITHHLTFLPDFVCESIELASRIIRKVYFSVLYGIHDRGVQHHHDFVDSMVESGLVNAASVACGIYLAFAGFFWLVNRFTDGIFPSDRALNKETRRRAEEYMRSKRAN